MKRPAKRAEGKGRPGAQSRRSQGQGRRSRGMTGVNSGSAQTILPPPFGTASFRRSGGAAGRQVPAVDRARVVPQFAGLRPSSRLIQQKSAILSKKSTGRSPDFDHDDATNSPGTFAPAGPLSFHKSNNGRDPMKRGVFVVTVVGMAAGVASAPRLRAGVADSSRPGPRSPRPRSPRPPARRPSPRWRRARRRYRLC
jgi:hypothetical protein